MKISARLLQWVVFLDLHCQLFCLFVQLEITDVQNILETSEPRPKQNRRPEPLKQTKDPPLAILILTWIFFGTETFFENFLTAPKGPLQLFDIFAMNGC